jgi:hypothetical protein
MELGTKAVGALQLKNAALGEVEAIVATLGVVDRDAEIIAPGAIPNGAAVKLSGYGHDAMLGEAPVGKGQLFAQGDTVRFKGRFFLSTQRGAESFATVRELGGDQEWSFGFALLESRAPSAPERARGAQKVLTRLDPFEVSPVIRGAGIGTGTLSAKRAGVGGDVGADPGAMRELGDDVRRSLDRATTLLEPDGVRALHVAAWAAKRLRSAYPEPLVIFFDPNGEQDGYFTARTPDRIYVSKGLDPARLVEVVIHETCHQADWPHDSEFLAAHAAALLAPSYLDQYGLGRYL